LTWRDLRHYGSIELGSEVNRLTDGRSGERSPTFNHSHADLTGREQRTEHSSVSYGGNSASSEFGRGRLEGSIELNSRHAYSNSDFTCQCFLDSPNLGMTTIEF
jgi:hypothetical protein